MSFPDRHFRINFRSDNCDQRLTLGFGSITTITERDYEKLLNKPSINGVELIGDKSGIELLLVNRDEFLTNDEIDDIWALNNPVTGTD